jgi:hypothetical protein
VVVVAHVPAPHDSQEPSRRAQAAIEAHLSRRAGELFAVDNEVLLYDVTSTYFEGQAAANPLAQRGYSRDHRPDCKQVLIALVVTFDGFPLGYEVFAGNIRDLQDRADDCDHHGSPARGRGARVDRRPRHGEPREPGVAALALLDRLGVVLPKCMRLAEAELPAIPLSA